MARPVDHDRRRELLAATVDYLGEHGLAGLTLRPLARAIGTTDRMLIHHFGSKESLIEQALAASRPPMDEIASSGATPADLAHHLWVRMTRGDQRPRVMLMIEVMALAATQPGYRSAARSATQAWVDAVTIALRDGGIPDPATTATALVSGLKGLALDAFATDDEERTDAAATLLIERTLHPEGVHG